VIDLGLGFEDLQQLIQVTACVSHAVAPHTVGFVCKTSRYATVGTGQQRQSRSKVLDFITAR
jgi:hypothetical protein